MTPPSAARKAEKRDRAADEARALNEGIKRLTVDMPIAAHRALKNMAADEDKSMNDIVMEALAKQGLRWE